MSKVFKILDFEPDNMIITSVMRLSDKQIFRLGDIVLHKNNVSNRNGVIAKFEAYTSSDSMFVQCSNNGSGYNVPLSFLLHNDNKKKINDELHDVYMEMREVRNEIRDRHDKTVDYLDAGRLKLEIKGADKMLSIMDKYFKNET